VDPHDLLRKTLEQRTIAAHRAYIDALVAWESAIRAAAPETGSREDRERRCESAKAEKERCRVAFRDLCNKLGYVPSGHGVGLPTEATTSSEGRFR